MKKHDGTPVDRILFSTILVLFLLLIGMTATLIVLLSVDSGLTEDDFILDMITADSADRTDISQILPPAFIGITSGKERKGVSFSPMVIHDMADTFAESISSALSEQNMSDATESEWQALTAAQSSVYFRFHSEMPGSVVGLTADLLARTESVREDDFCSIHEMFLLPKDAGNGAVLYTRSVRGDVRKFTVPSDQAGLTKAEIDTIFQSYASALVDFAFSEDTYSCVSYTEPYFVGKLELPSILTTNGTADMIGNYGNGANALMSLFGMNPDKVGVTYDEDDFALGYIDPMAVLYTRQSTFEYRATAEGGVRIANIVGYSSDENRTEDYLRAAYTILLGVREIDQNFVAGDGDVYLSSLQAKDGQVTVEFSYAYGNIPIVDTQPALRAVFEDDILKEAVIYTVSVTPRKTRLSDRVEFGFLTYLEDVKKQANDVTLVYRADYRSESVLPEWTAQVVK